MDHPACFVILVLGFGASGGFVRGLLSPSEYRLNLPVSKKYLHLGFIGDLLVGGAGGLLVFLVAASIVPADWKLSEKSTAMVVQVCALSLLAGICGRQVIEYSSKTLVDRMGKQLQRGLEAEKLARHASFLTAQGKFFNAVIFYNQALALEPDDEQILLDKAYALKRLDPPKHLEEALGLVERVTKMNSKNARAFYNRACYEAALGRSESDALTDLETAIGIDPLYREFARVDKDLERFQNSPRFRAIASGE